METRKSLISLVQIHLSLKKPQVLNHWALKGSAHFSLTEHHPTFHFNISFSTDNCICSRNQGTSCKIVTQEMPFHHLRGSCFLM